VEPLCLLGEGLHEAGVAHLAHEEVVKAAGRVLGVELERVPAFDGELLPSLGFGIYCGKGICWRYGLLEDYHD